MAKVKYSKVMRILQIVSILTSLSLETIAMIEELIRNDKKLPAELRAEMDRAIEARSAQPTKVGKALKRAAKLKSSLVIGALCPLTLLSLLHW